jgi:hypothetical protein
MANDSSLDSVPSVENVDQSSDGVVVTFKDGSVVLYTPGFLWEHRNRDGNLELHEKSAPYIPIDTD